MPLKLLSSLRMRLVFLVILGVIPSLGLILNTAAQTRRLAANEAQAGALRVARLVAGDQQRLIDEARQLLATLARLPEVRGGRSDACSALLADLLEQNPRYANLGVVDANGQVVCSAVPEVSSTGLEASPFIQQAFENGRFAVGGYSIDPLVHLPVIGLGYPVLGPDEQVRSVVFATLSLGWLNRQVTAAQLPVGAVLIATDADGTVLMHLPNPDKWLGQTLTTDPLVSSILGKPEGTAELDGLDDVSRLYGFTQLDAGSGSVLHFAIGISKEQAFFAADQILGRHLAGLAAVFTLALAAAWIGGDMIVLRRVRALLNATQRLAAGDLSARTGLPYGQGELSDLARMFDQMGSVLEQREHERLEADAAIKRHMRDLTALNTVITRISSSLDLTEVLEGLKRLLYEQLNIPGGVILLQDEKTSSLYVEAAWGLPPATLAVFKPFPQLSKNYLDVIRKKEPCLYEDLSQVEPYASAGLQSMRPHLTSYLCVPLMAKGEILGVLDLFGSSGAGSAGTGGAATLPAATAFPADQVQLLTTLGQEVGVVIQNARLFNEVVSGRGRLQALSQQLIEVQENERRHLSRELHDEIGQALTAVKVNLQAMGRLVDLSSFGPHMEDSIGIIDRAIQQVRTLSLDLRPSLLDDLGIAAALRWYVDRVAQRAGFEAHFSANLADGRLPVSLETTCFRVVQEALTNVVRHAQAKHVEVELNQTSEVLEIKISDDGVGFDVDAVNERNTDDASLGLMGMRERVELIGGQIEIDSGLARGTRICTYLPLVPQGSAQAQE